jgi:hypothetical protein
MKEGEEQNVGEQIVLRWILERQDEVVWIGLVWFRTRTAGGHLRVR